MSSKKWFAYLFPVGSAFLYFGASWLILKLGRWPMRANQPRPVFFIIVAVTFLLLICGALLSMNLFARAEQPDWKLSFLLLLLSVSFFLIFRFRYQEIRPVAPLLLAASGYFLGRTATSLLGRCPKNRPSKARSVYWVPCLFALLFALTAGGYCLMRLYRIPYLHWSPWVEFGAAILCGVALGLEALFLPAQSKRGVILLRLAFALLFFAAAFRQFSEAMLIGMMGAGYELGAAVWSAVKFRRQAPVLSGDEQHSPA